MLLKERISQIINNHIYYHYYNNDGSVTKIITALKILLSDSFDNYSIIESISSTEEIYDAKHNIDSLAKINEKENRRKKEGVYYTDTDVTNCIAANAIIHYINPDDVKIYGYDKAMAILNHLSNKQKEIVISSKVFDPTCGTGEFLLSILKIKLLLCQSIECGIPYILCNSIFGNDISEQSTDISKIRLFFMFVDSIGIDGEINNIANSIKHNFTNFDAVRHIGHNQGNMDIIIGNPPYVEYRNYAGEIKYDYGNIYADVLHNCIGNLSNNGVISFVIPLSYVSTKRMSKLRGYVIDKMDKQIVVNFADRPDCLFSGVHQKLTILIASKHSIYKGVLSSSYNYWYQSERRKLFDNIRIIPTIMDNKGYWPKIGNEIEESTYNKMKDFNGIGITSLPVSFRGYKSIYMNLRACFWMKVFIEETGSSSYAEYKVPFEFQAYLYCMLNSSLFFLIWVIISDGWHITNKELMFIKIPKQIKKNNIWELHMHRLIDRLEDTKVFVNTKQVLYEYKHKKCKDVIDKIDNELAKVYGLSETELAYVKDFALKYRMSDEAKD